MKKEKIEIFFFNISSVRRVNGTLGAYFKLEKLRVIISKSFASLCCVCLGAAPIYRIVSAHSQIKISSIPEKALILYSGLIVTKVVGCDLISTIFINIWV